MTSTDTPTPDRSYDDALLLQAFEQSIVALRAGGCRCMLLWDCSRRRAMPTSRVDGDLCDLRDQHYPPSEDV